jgi:hypothetical protein
VSIVAREELFASKTIALLTRRAARDLYDIYCLSLNESFPLKKSLLRKYFIFYGAIARDDFRTMSVETIDQVTPRDIKRTLYPLLQRELVFDLEKNRLRVKRFVGALFHFTHKEYEFIDSFFEGRYQHELLFNAKYFSKHLAQHPMVEWKLSHIRKHLIQRKNQ